MFMMFTVASLCIVLLAGSLLGLACRHLPEMWITSDDVLLCLVFPVLIVIATFGGISLGWRITQGGLSEVPTYGWIGSVVIVAATFVAWFVIAPRIRGKRSIPPAADPVPT